MKATKGGVLGFGCMRMPTLEAGKPNSFDFEKIEAMFDSYIGAGFTYFDNHLIAEKPTLSNTAVASAPVR